MNHWWTCLLGQVSRATLSQGSNPERSCAARVHVCNALQTTERQGGEDGKGVGVIGGEHEGQGGKTGRTWAWSEGSTGGSACWCGAHDLDGGGDDVRPHTWCDTLEPHPRGPGQAPGFDVVLPLWKMDIYICCLYEIQIWWDVMYLWSKVKVTQCPTSCNPVAYTVLGILQARILEWGAFPFSRGSSQPKDRTQVSLIAGGFFTSWAITWNFLLWVENFLIYSGY